MKKVIIIHGCPSDKEKAMNPETRTYDKHWLPWVQGKLNEKGIKAERPLMPEPWTPNYEKFKAEFEKYDVDENTILVGTSCGCSFLVHWLGETKKRISKLILVAPWKIEEGASELEKAFYEFPIDEGIRNRVGEIIIFTSDNEKEDGKKGVIMFHEAFGGKVIELKSHGHYLMKDMGTVEFAELLEVILN